MMYKLYWAEDSGALAPHIVLQELGVEYELDFVDLEKGEESTPDFLAINPRGQVPALVLDDGTILTETAAILLHLADCHPRSRLLPPMGSRERALIYRWLFFAAVNLYEGYLRFYYSDRYTTRESQSGEVRNAASEYLDVNWGQLENALGEGPYFLGESYSVLDPYLLTLSNWHQDTEALFASNPKLQCLCAAVRSRAAVECILPLHFP